MDTTEQTIEMHVVENVTTKRRQIASFPIESVRGDFSSEMDNVIVGEIHPAPGELAPGLRTWSYPHFKNVVFDRFNTELGMIIGASHVHLWIPGKDIKIGKKNEPIALETHFGWTVLGGGGGGKSNYATSNAITATNAELASNLDKRPYLGNESSERGENDPIQLATDDLVGSHENLEFKNLTTTTTTITTMSRSSATCLSP